MKCKSYIKRILSILLLLIWLFFIFDMSAKTGEESSGLSLKIAYSIHEIKYVNDFIKLNILHTLIRKTAHFTEYAILALLGYGFFSSFEMKLEYSNKKIYLKKIFANIMFCLIVAVSDEFHQSFVPGRGPSIIDVGIDICGSIAFLGILILVEMAIIHKKENTEIH